MIKADDNKGTAPSGKRTGILAALLLFLAVISIALYTYLQSQNIDIGTLNPGQLLAGSRQGSIKAAAQAYAITYDSKEHPVYSVYMDYIVKCTADGISLLDKKGQEVLTEGIPLVKPLIKAEGSYLLVTDTGGMEILVIKDRSIVWREKTDQKILNAEINSRGYATVITDSKRYNGEVRLYDPYGVDLYQSYIATDFVVTAKVSDKSRRMVVDSIDAKGAEAFTTLKFFDPDGKETVDRDLDASGNIYPSIWYLGDDSIFAAGTTAITLLDKDRQPKWEKKFAGISAACLSSGSHIAAVVQDTKGVELKVLDKDGQELSSTAIGGEKSGLTAKDGIIALNTLREAEFYNEKGRCISKYSSNSDITGVFLFDRQQAAVITKTSVDIVNIG